MRTYSEELCHTVKENIMTPIQFSYVRRDMLFYAVTASQHKITHHNAHMIIELDVFTYTMLSIITSDNVRVVVCYYTAWQSSSPVVHTNPFSMFVI